MDGAWKYELGTQVSLFLDLLRDSIQAVGPIHGELASRLEGYRTRLKPEPKHPFDRSSTASSLDKGDAASIRSVQTTKLEGLRGPATDDVAQVFGLSDEWLTGKLKELQGVCTEQAALDDLKVSSKAVIPAPLME